MVRARGRRGLAFDGVWVYVKCLLHLQPLLSLSKRVGCYKEPALLELEDMSIASRSELLLSFARSTGRK